MPAYVLKCEGCGRFGSFLIHESQLPEAWKKPPIQRYCPSYVLFARMGASQRTLWIETAIACGFSLFAILGFKRNLWFVVAGAAR